MQAVSFAIKYFCVEKIVATNNPKPKIVHLRRQLVRAERRLVGAERERAAAPAVHVADGN